MKTWERRARRAAWWIGVVSAWVGGSTADIARADVPVRFDCFLPEGPVECRALGRAYFESIGCLRPDDDRDENAAVAVRVRATPVRNGKRMFVDFAGAGAAAHEAPHFTLAETDPSRLG